MTEPAALENPLPHEFSELRAGDRSPSLIIGAGLSFGRVPLPNELLAEVQNRAEAALGCGAIAGLPDDGTALYVWAEKALANTPPLDGVPAKLRLARAIGLLDDRRWAVHVELNGGLPRHRVIARFAREELFSAIWSLNWDCMLESALEGIGFTRGEAQREQPWLTRYASVVIGEDFNHLSRNRLLAIRKPHGCAHALLEAEEAIRAGQVARAEEIASRFMITTAELRQRRAGILDDKFFVRMIADLSTLSLIVAGWSVSEPYLRAVVDELARLRNPGQLEDLSIIDIAFRTGHEQIATSFQLTKENVFFEVTALEAGFDVDDILLWLQAKYCLDQLIEHAEQATRAILEPISAAFRPHDANPVIVGWADQFLPAWTRMCWRGGTINCPGFDSDKIDMNKPHEYIPWRVQGTPRPDLCAAARLLSVLPLDGRWDTKELPGVLFHKATNTAVIPVPAWAPVDVLTAMRPLIDSISPKLSFVDRIEVLPLHHRQLTATLDPNLREELSAGVASLLRVPAMADLQDVQISESLGV